MFSKQIATNDGTVHAVTGYIDEKTAKKVITTETVGPAPGSRIAASVEVNSDENETGIRTAVQLLRDALEEHENRLRDGNFKA